MKKENITLKDIAKVAGVSTATASLALAGDPRVNVKTKKLVEEVAQRLQYVPNEIGRSLRAKKAETVALIFPNTPHNAFTHPYFVQLLEGISEVLVQNGFQLLLSTTPSEADEAAAYDKILRNRRADGIILWPASIKDSNIPKIIESGFPVVYLGKWHHDDIVTIQRDDFGGAYEATEQLIRNGRKRIVHLAGPLDYQVSIDRVEGYKQALQDNKILFDPALLVEADFSREMGDAAVQKLHEQAVRYDAIFAANDRMAIGAMRRLRALGLSVPQDAAVIGCDNIETGELIEPALTSIHQPMREIGRLAAERIVAMLTGQAITDKQTMVSSSLVIRESCGTLES